MLGCGCTFARAEWSVGAHHWARPMHERSKGQLEYSVLVPTQAQPQSDSGKTRNEPQTDRFPKPNTEDPNGNDKAESREQNGQQKAESREASREPQASSEGRTARRRAAHPRPAHSSARSRVSLGRRRCPPPPARRRGWRRARPPPPSCTPSPAPIHSQPLRVR